MQIGWGGDNEAPLPNRPVKKRVKRSKFTILIMILGPVTIVTSNTVVLPPIMVLVHFFEFWEFFTSVLWITYESERFKADSLGLRFGLSDPHFARHPEFETRNKS